MLAGFFEGLGILLRRKLIDLALGDDLFSSDMLLTGHKMKPIVEGGRKQFNQSRISEWFEYLHNEMQKREQQLAKLSKNALSILSYFQLNTIQQSILYKKVRTRKSINK